MEQNKNTKAFFQNKEILILEDDHFLAKRLVAQFENYEADVTSCSTLEDARKALENLTFDFALFDLNLPDGESLDLLRKKRVPSNTLLILMTAEGGITSAVEAMRLGAVDYLSKPFEIDEIPLLFLKCDRQRKNQRFIQHTFEKRKQKTANLFFKGSFKEDLQQLTKITEVDQRLQTNLPPLLIGGPTGSGKSTYARWVHDHGPRHNAAFVAINCSAIPHSLIESELFGHEKGAFTDAKNSRIGLFEAADNGTLFLDEVASLSLPAQAKVLLAIENGIIRRLGGTKEINVDVRIIAAANQDLRQMIAEKQFREDLFHRLDLLRINIPPLNTRGNDIIALASYFLQALCQKYKISSSRLSKESEVQLLTHQWTGNARELIHELERSLIMSERGEALEISASRKHPNEPLTKPEGNDWLNPSFSIPTNGFKLEKEMIRMLELGIKQANGNISEAARLLGVPRDYIRYRLQKKGK